MTQMTKEQCTAEQIDKASLYSGLKTVVGDAGSEDLGRYV